RPQPTPHTLRPAHSHDPRRPRHLGTRPHRPLAYRTVATHRMELAGPHRHIPPLPACTRPDELLPTRRPLHRLPRPRRRGRHLATPHTRTLNIGIPPLNVVSMRYHHSYAQIVRPRQEPPSPYRGL